MATDVERLVQVRQMCLSGEARRRRLAAHVSLSELGDACHASLSTVQKWELGARLPRRHAALRYLAALEAIGRAAA